MTTSSGPETSAQRLTKADPKTAWLAVLLAGITFALFAPAIRYDYVDYDDGVYVYANQHVLRGLSLDGVRYAFTSIKGGSWMPLTWLSHMLDISMFGASPEGPHLMNVLLHSLSASVLLLALQRLTGRVWPSLLVAALFALHPLRNESVVWVAERKDVLSVLLCNLGLLAYGRYVRTPIWKRFASVVSWFALGLLAKPMLVSFPFVLLLLDFWPLNRLGHDRTSFCRSLWPCIREKIPLFILSIVFCGVTLWSQDEIGAVSHKEFSVLTHAAQVVGNYAFYLEKFFAPAQLTILYPSKSPESLTTTALALALLVATGFIFWRTFHQPWLVTGWLWFLGTLVPVIGLVRIGHITVADRYSYLPSIGLGIMVVWSISELAQTRVWARRAAVAVGIFTVLLCAQRTRADLPRWRNSLTLFGSALAVAPHAVLHNNIGVYYLDRQQFGNAIEPLSRAIEMDPNYLKAILNRATAYQKLGRDAEAKADYDRLARIEPRTPEGFNNRGDLLMELGRLDEAINDFSAAIQLSPHAANSYNNRASARLMKGEFTQALADCAKAIELNPRYANAHNTQANVYNRLGDLPRALAGYNRAIELAPADPLTYNNRAAVFLALKQYERARADVRQCRELGGVPHEGLLRALSSTETGGR